MSDLLFRDIGELFDGPHATPKRIDEGPYFLNISSLDAGRLDLSQSDHVSDEEFKKWTRRVTPQEDDLLFSYETRLGEAALMPGGVAACLGRRMALLRPDRERIVPRFLLYYYLSPHFQDLIQQRQIQGATVPRIGLATMGEWPISIPSLENQRAISDVLGALDDKIAANERVSSTLDNLIRFEYLSLKGEPVPLGGLAKNVRDQVKPEVVDGEAIYLGLEHLPREHFWVTGHGNTSEITSAKSRFEEGDVLFGKLRPYFHKVVSAPFGGVCSTDVLVIRAMESDLAGLILAAVGSKETVAAAVSSSEGTRMPRTSWKDLSDTSIRWPGRSVAESFSHEVQRRADLAAKLGAESRALARARDELLPLLMSGKITVKDAEKVVSDVV
ncbi:MAG TPA: restriction endonuclease subunit S [Brevibacterium sp.]|nr:restriction endonuclease subunit S [Brevibacterium sp.]